jgi:hypothetical protein
MWCINSCYNYVTNFFHSVPKEASKTETFLHSSTFRSSVPQSICSINNNNISVQEQAQEKLPIAEYNHSIKKWCFVFRDGITISIFFATSIESMATFAKNSPKLFNGISVWALPVSTISILGGIMLFWKNYAKSKNDLETLQKIANSEGDSLNEIKVFTEKTNVEFIAEIAFDPISLGVSTVTLAADPLGKLQDFTKIGLYLAAGDVVAGVVEKKCNNDFVHKMCVDEFNNSFGLVYTAEEWAFIKSKGANVLTSIEIISIESELHKNYSHSKWPDKFWALLISACSGMVGGLSVAAFLNQCWHSVKGVTYSSVAGGILSTLGTFVNLWYGSLNNEIQQLDHAFALRSGNELYEQKIAAEVPVRKSCCQSYIQLLVDVGKQIFDIETFNVILGAVTFATNAILKKEDGQEYLAALQILNLVSRIFLNYRRNCRIAVVNGMDQEIRQKISNNINLLWSQPVVVPEKKSLEITLDIENLPRTAPIPISPRSP